MPEVLRGGGFLSAHLVCDTLRAGNQSAASQLNILLLRLSHLYYFVCPRSQIQDFIYSF